MDIVSTPQPLNSSTCLPAGRQLNLHKILYISYDGMTDPLGQSQVIPYLRELSLLGYQITILSVEKKERYKKHKHLIEKLLKDAGIKWEVLFFRSFPPFLSKLLDQNELSKRAKLLYLKNYYNLIHCRSYVAAEAGLYLHRKFKVPFLFDMRGFWVDERVDGGIWNLNNPIYWLLYKVYKKKERNYFNKAAHVISLTNKGKDELVKTYSVLPEKITVIPCCADLNHFDYKKVKDQEKEIIRQRLGISKSKLVLSYLGSLGGWYMIDEMLEFYSVLRAKLPASLFMFITQDKKEEIMQRAARHNIPKENLMVVPATREEVPPLLAISDWNIFFIKDLYSKIASSPTKQGEVMGMGLPIICNSIGDTGDIIRKAEAGFVINGFDPKEYANVIERMTSTFVTDRDKIRSAAFLNYDLSEGVSRYLSVYKKILIE